MIERPLACRVPVHLLERLDNYVEKLREEQPEWRHSRAAVVRLLLTRALDEAEQKDRRRRRRKA